MGAPESNTTNIYGIHLRESANDGSDFSNAASDYRVLFLGEDGSLHVKDSAGTVTDPFSSSGIAATIFDAKGDIIAASAADTAARLAVGTNGTRLEAASGESTGLRWTLPPGHEFDYAEFTSTVSPTATTEGTANTVVTGNAVTYDGSTIILVEFAAPFARPAISAGALIHFWLYDGSSSIGRLGTIQASGASDANIPVRVSRRLTPSAASHTYSIRSSVSTGTGSVGAGAGGNGNVMPGYIRITKV